jgi:hypothetical protein
MQIGNLSLVDTDGGPLIAIPHRVLERWDGIHPPRDGRTIDVAWQFDKTRLATDYDRALNAPAPVSTIDVGGAAALVLGSYVDNAAWLPLIRGATVGAFVRVEAVAAKIRLFAMVERVVSQGDEADVVRWQIDDRLRLLDATVDGRSSPGEGIDIDVPAGDYDVYTSRHSDRSIGEVVLHRLQRC